jgi:WD40 repeat protein
VYQVRFEPGGARVISTTQEGGISVLDVTSQTAQEFQVRHTAANLVGSDVSANGSLLVAGGYFNPISLMRLSNKTVFRLPRNEFSISSAAASHDGLRVCFVGGQGRIHLLQVSKDVLSKVEERQWATDSGAINATAISPLGHLLLTAGDRGSALLWDLDASPRCVRTYICLRRKAPRRLADVAFSPAGRWLGVAVQYEDQNVAAVFDLAIRKWAWVLEMGQAAPKAPQFSADGERLFAVVRDSETAGGRISSLKMSDGTGLEFEGVEGVTDFAVLGNGETLLVARAADSGTVEVWDRPSQRIARTLATGCGKISRLDLTPNRRWLRITSAENPPTIIDVETGKKTVVDYPEVADIPLVLHPDGEQIAFLPKPDEVGIFDLKQSAVLMSASDRSANSGAKRVLSISPDGRLMATVASDETNPNANGVTLWDLRSYRSLYTLPTYDLMPSSLAWSADSRTLAAGLQPTTVEDGPELILWHLGRDE